jgi:GAF domain-containing protein
MLIRGDDGDAHYHDERERVDIGSAICAPLLWGERLLGVLNVSVTRRDRQHDERDLETLKSLSRRISRILFQSLKLDELQVHHQEWRFRSTMGEIAVKPISTQEKFSVLSKYLSELIGAETVEIYLNTAEGDWFVLGGSNRLLSPTDSRVRIQRGALSRSFLDNRTIVLTEGSQSSAEPLDGISSAVFCPLGMGRLLGVLAFEFSQQYKLDEFMLVKDSIVHEISRFLTSETRERKLNREVRALRMISDGAPAILGCRSIKSLADALASAAAVVLECDHVSVRLAENLGSDGYIESYFGVPNDILLEWRKGDQERFDSLERERKARSTAFLTFDPRVRETGSASDDETSAYRSALVFPIMSNDGFIGGIMAYDKNSDDPLEDAIFSDLDRKTLEHLVDLAKPVLESILRRRPLADARDSAPIEAVTAESLDRLKEMCDAEISRSDRYHNTFTLVLLRVELINTLLDTDRKRGLTLIEEMSQGLKTRTRKTDFGVWIKPDTYAILTLDGGRRIRFLISRAVMYLEKDLSTITGFPPEAKRVSVGVADYPGKAKSGDEMLAEAEKSLKPYQQE